MNRMFERLRLQEHFNQIYARFGEEVADDMIAHAYEQLQARRRAKRLQEALKNKRNSCFHTIEDVPF